LLPIRSRVVPENRPLLATAWHNHRTLVLNPRVHYTGEAAGVSLHRPWRPRRRCDASWGAGLCDFDDAKHTPCDIKRRPSAAARRAQRARRSRSEQFVRTRDRNCRPVVAAPPTPCPTARGKGVHPWISRRHVAIMGCRTRWPPQLRRVNQSAAVPVAAVTCRALV
jgi:hypothetical protein